MNQPPTPHEIEAAALEVEYQSSFALSRSKYMFYIRFSVVCIIADMYYFFTTETLWFKWLSIAALLFSVGVFGWNAFKIGVLDGSHETRKVVMKALDKKIEATA